MAGPKTKATPRPTNNGETSLPHGVQTMYADVLDGVEGQGAIKSLMEQAPADRTRAEAATALGAALEGNE